MTQLQFFVGGHQPEAAHKVHNIVVPVPDALARFDDLYSNLRAAPRAAFLILRGSSSSEESTFLHMLAHFRQDLEARSLESRPTPGLTIHCVLTNRSFHQGL